MSGTKYIRRYLVVLKSLANARRKARNQTRTSSCQTRIENIGVQRCQESRMVALVSFTLSNYSLEILDFRSVSSTSMAHTTNN